VLTAACALPAVALADGLRVVRVETAPPPAMRGEVVRVVRVDTAPPAPIYEPVPAYRAGYVWAPGYWQWSGTYTWVPGRWEGDRVGYTWVPDRWTARDGYWYYDAGYWDSKYRDHWDDSLWTRWGGWDGTRRDHYSYNEDPRGYLRFDR
jgi:hypothetical protein